MDNGMVMAFARSAWIDAIVVKSSDTDVVDEIGFKEEMEESCALKRSERVFYFPVLPRQHWPWWATELEVDGLDWHAVRMV
jgi:hypothetical protein